MTNWQKYFTPTKPPEPPKARTLMERMAYLEITVVDLQRQIQILRDLLATRV